MNFGIQKKESHTCIKVFAKHLDAGLAPELKSELLLIVNKGESNLLVDLTACEGADSSGLSALLLGNRLCRDKGGKFVLCGISPAIREIMDLAGMESLLETVRSGPDAEKHFT